MPDDRSFDDPRPPTEEEWGTPLVAPQSAPDLERTFRRRIGMVSGAVPYVTPHPWLHRPFLFLADSTLTALPQDLAAAISFIIARDNSCRFCYSTYRTMLRLSNYSPSDLEALETDFAAQAFREEEEWALRFGVRLSRADHVAPALDRLQALGHSTTAIREMAGVAVMNVAINRIGTTLSIPVCDFERLADAWYLRPWRAFVWPLLRLSKTWRRRGPSDVPSLEPDGLLAPWVNTVRGTPVGGLLQQMTARWRSAEGALAQQTKLLMLAVIARGVSADELEGTLCSALRRQHGLSDDAYNEAVGHLGGPAVNEETGALLRLARASIRYDFGPIKRIARDCTQALDRRGTLEAIASISLANALARLEHLFPLETG